MSYSENPVFEAMYQRKCIREFEETQVPMEDLQELLEAAGRAPSSKNTQPWKLFDIRGEKMEALDNTLQEVESKEAELDEALDNLDF